MAAFDTTRTAYGSTPAVTRILGFFGAFFAAVEDWQDSRATRKALSDLTDLELQDIGLIRGDIDLVAQNHFVRPARIETYPNKKPQRKASAAAFLCQESVT